MRRGQKAGLKRIPNYRKPANLAELTQPIVYGCALPPKATLAHKYVKVLKRLIKGTESLIRMDGKWYWSKGQKLLGTVKNALIWALKDAKLIHGIGGRWLITSMGMNAVKAEQPMYAYSNMPKVRRLGV